MQRDPGDSNILWVGTEGNGLYRYNLKTEHYIRFNADNSSGKYHFPSNTVFNILVSRNKDIYFATKKGVSRWNHVARNFSEFTHNSLKKNSLSRGYVIALCEDSIGNIWMGTDRSGISIYNPKTDAFRNLQSKNGSGGKNALSNNRINVIFNDRHNNIWVGIGSEQILFCY
jgi:ligand-binding sensor domain-containing protein